MRKIYSNNNFFMKKAPKLLGCAVTVLLLCGMAPLERPAELPLYPKVPEKINNFPNPLIKSPSSTGKQNFLDLEFYSNTVPCRDNRFAGNNLCYKNYRTPQEREFNNDGLYFAIDGAIAKFNDLTNTDKAKRGNYQEVIRNCGGKNETGLGWRPLPKQGPNRYTDDLHPRWSGGLALGRMSAADNTIVAYSSSYGDTVNPVYRNYRTISGSPYIVERKDFRAEADRNGSAIAATDSGAAVDTSGNYWKQKAGTGEKVEFQRQDQSTGAFAVIRGFTADADPVWARAKITASYEFDLAGYIHVLAFDERMQDLWLYRLDTVTRKAVREKHITGDLADKEVLFLPNGKSRTNGLAWWGKTWWVMRQDKRADQTREKDVKLYKVDPRTGVSEEWLTGTTLDDKACYTGSWLGNLASVEQMPKNPGAALTAKVTASTLSPRRNEIVSYTIDVQNVGWSPYSGEIEVDLSGITESPSKDPNISEPRYDISGGAATGDWAWKGKSLIWKGTVPPSPQDNGRNGGKVTIAIDFRVDETAPHGKNLPVTVNTAAETISDCAKGADDRKSSCQAVPRVHAQPQLEIVKKQELLNNGIVRYTITALNKGTAGYSDEIVDNLSNASFVAVYDPGSASATVAGRARGALVRSGTGTLTWNKEDGAILEPGEALVISYHVTIKPGTMGPKL